jgi:hypothetical protein
MGYTHYWEATPICTEYGYLPTDAFHAFIQDVIHVIAESTKRTYPVELSGYWYSKELKESYTGQLSLYEMTDFFIGHGDMGELMVIINGKEPYDYETACFSITPSTSEFCKTEHRPYDDVVCVLLISYAHHFPGYVEVKSDGDSTDWERAATWYQDIFQRELPAEGPWNTEK